MIPQDDYTRNLVAAKVKALREEARRATEEVNRLESAMKDDSPNVRILMQHDASVPFACRVGEKVLTKYGDVWTVKAFVGREIYFEETDKALQDHRLSHVVDE
jgi:hypothetical protein